MPTTDIALPPTVSLPEQIYQKLRMAILEGRFEPGQMLRQEEVAAQLGVSRSPLREALPRLEAEGIVTLLPRRGYAVVSLDPEDISEIFDLRVLLEVDLARHAFRRRRRADITRAETVLKEMRDLFEVDAFEHRQRWFGLNSRFHDALVSPAGRRFHIKAFDTARGLIERYIRMEINLTGDFDQAYDEHEAMFEAYAGDSVEPFATLVRDHALHTRDRLLSGLARSR